MTSFFLLKYSWISLTVTGVENFDSASTISFLGLVVLFPMFLIFIFLQAGVLSPASMYWVTDLLLQTTCNMSSGLWNMRHKYWYNCLANNA